MIPTGLLAVTLLGGGGDDDPEKRFDENHRRVVPRDSFDVFDHPEMLSAEDAEAEGYVASTDLVIGLASGDEAKAYPLPIMGTAELGNDTIGGIPVAVSW